MTRGYWSNVSINLHINDAFIGTADLTDGLAQLFHHKMEDHTLHNTRQTAHGCCMARVCVLEVDAKRPMPITDGPSASDGSVPAILMYSAGPSFDSCRVKVQGLLSTAWLEYQCQQLQIVRAHIFLETSFKKMPIGAFDKGRIPKLTSTVSVQTHSRFFSRPPAGGWP